MDSSNSTIFKEAKEARFQPHPLLQTIIFAAFFVFSQFSSLIFFALLLIVTGNSSLAAYGDIVSIILLFSTILPLGAILFYIRFGEGRSLRSAGFVKEKALPSYGKGLIFGIGILAVTTAFVYFSGGITSLSLNPDFSPALFFAFAIAFIIQGMEEELMLRGYYMVSLSNKIPTLAAVIINAAFFALMHIGNPGVTPFSMVNLLLFGIFASFYFIRSDNIWGIGAFHSIWNFGQGCILNFNVSGLTFSSSLLSVTLNEDNALFHGGSFGLEGGAAFTSAIAIGILLLLLGRKKRPGANHEPFL